MTALAGAVLAFGAAAPAAFATLPPEPGGTGDTAPVVIHTVIVGGIVLAENPIRPGGSGYLVSAGAG